MIKKQISELTYEKQLTFAVTICKELYPNYQEFYEIYQWGNPTLLMTAIYLCEHYTGTADQTDEIKDMIVQLNFIIPDTEDYGDWLGSYALDAGVVVEETLRFILDKDNSHIYNIAVYYDNTTDFKAQEQKILTEEELSKHPQIIDARNFLLNLTK